MITADHKLSISRQAKLLGMSRGSVYYVPRPVSPADLALMRRMDELHLNYPFMGSRQLRNMLVRESHRVGRTHVGTLMKRMGIEAIYRKPGTSARHPGHQVFPYLLRKLNIQRANQVWALDTTYIPLARGFVYLTAVLDWATRKVMAAKVAITLEACHAVDVLQEAFSRHTGRRISSTPIRATNLRRWSLYAPFMIEAASSAWTDAAPGGITSSSSGCGNRSNMKKYSRSTMLNLPS